MSRVILSAVLLSVVTVGAVQAQNVDMTGNIRDSSGKPIAAASIFVKDSRLGTVSDTLGFFHLKVKHKDSLIISAVGYHDTVLAVGRLNRLSVVLLQSTKPLQEVIVNSAGPTQEDLAARQRAATDEIIDNTFREWDQQAEFSNGQYVVTYEDPTKRGAAAMVRLTYTGFGPLNTLTSGTMMPVVHHQEETRGSRYLLRTFVRGVIIDKDHRVMIDSVHLINYDKIDGQLLIAEGQGNFLEVDKDKILAFGMKTQDTSFVFVNVPVLSKVNYFMVVAKGPKYSVYKSLRTAFHRANYQSNGLVESGHDYDEYVDKETYFWVRSGDSTGMVSDSAGVFELKKKSIKAAFAGEKAKVDAFFSQHKYEDIDDSFVRRLVVYLNKP